MCGEHEGQCPPRQRKTRGAQQLDQPPGKRGHMVSSKQWPIKADLKSAVWANLVISMCINLN